MPAPGARRTILIVDDMPDNLAVIHAVLKDEYRTKIAKSGAGALDVAWSDPPPDLILLDVMMPVMDGYAVCRQLKADPRTADVPVIFLTARTREQDEIEGFAAGAVDFITKPISAAIVRARVRTHLQLRDAREFMKYQIHDLDQIVAARTAALLRTQDVTILAFASLAETRDHETGNHIRRTQHYIRLLAQALRHHPRFRAVLDDDGMIDQLFKSAPLHDIGKVGIPDAILLKPGPLTAEEFAVMKDHTRLGRDAIAAAERSLGDVQSSFLAMARDLAYSHHERWDGSGYPEGLSGDAIPLSGRLMAVADNYDALISRRTYKPALPHDQALRMIQAGRGRHFDPDIVDALVGIADRFAMVADSFRDDGATGPAADLADDA